MKVVKTASGKKTLKMSKSEWEEIGKTAGWDKQAGLSFWEGRTEQPVSNQKAIEDLTDEELRQRASEIGKEFMKVDVEILEIERAYENLASLDEEKKALKAELNEIDAEFEKRGLVPESLNL